jgi:hypothetical protein
MQPVLKRLVAFLLLPICIYKPTSLKAHIAYCGKDFTSTISNNKVLQKDFPAAVIAKLFSVFT